MWNTFRLAGLRGHTGLAYLLERWRKLSYMARSGFSTCPAPRTSLCDRLRGGGALPPRSMARAQLPGLHP